MERSNTQVRLDLLANVYVFLHTNSSLNRTVTSSNSMFLFQQCIHATLVTLQMRGERVFVTFPLSAVHGYSDVRVPCWNVEVHKLFVNTHDLQLLMPKVHYRSLIEPKSR